MDEELNANIANMSDTRPELQGYSTIIGATYSAVEIEEIPVGDSEDPLWSIRFDDGDAIFGRLVDVVLNRAALRVAKKQPKMGRKSEKWAKVSDLENNEGYTKQERIAKNAEIKASYKGKSKYTAAERDEAYRNSIKMGNRPLLEDLAALPEWVQQAFLQQQSSNSDDLSVGDDTDHLPGNEVGKQPGVDHMSSTRTETDAGHHGLLSENETANKPSVEGTSSTEIEKDTGRRGDLPGNKIKTQPSVDDTNSTEIEPVADGHGILPANDIEDQTSVDDTSSKGIEPIARQRRVLLGDGIEAEPSVNNTSSTQAELDAGQHKTLPGNGIETEQRFDDKSFGPDAGAHELQPSHVMRRFSPIKRHVTIAEAQRMMYEEFANQPNFIQQARDRQADKQQAEQNETRATLQVPHIDKAPNTRRPPHTTQQPGPSQMATASIPATTKGFTIDEKVDLIRYGLDGPPPAKTPQATPIPGRLTATQEDAIQIIQEMLTDFCTTVLWPRYCRVPAGAATPELKALTSMTYDDRGVRAPTHRIPKCFLERALHELDGLFEVCRPDRRLLIQQVIRQPGFKGQDAEILLSEEMLWAHGPAGPWSKEVSLGGIGLLLEVFGIKAKGSIWKG